MFHSFGSSIFDAEAMRVMQMIDEWETLYQRGKSAQEELDIFGRFQKINLYLCPPDLGSHFQFSTFNCFTMRIDILSVVPELLESPLNPLDY